MNNIPRVSLVLVAVSRDCFPIELSRQRRDKVYAACRKSKLPIKVNVYTLLVPFLNLERRNLSTHKTDNQTTCYIKLKTHEPQLTIQVI